MTRKLVHSEVGVRIARVRTTLGLKKYQFAKVIAVTPATVGNYESGQMPRGDLLDKIARAGGVTVEWLLHGTEARGKQTSSVTRGSDLATLLLLPDVAPRDLLRLPPRYLERYQARMKEQIKRLRRELVEYRHVLKLEYRAERTRKGGQQ